MRLRAARGIPPAYLLCPLLSYAFRAACVRAGARWSLAVTRAEKGFRKLAGYRDLLALAEALKRPAKDAAEAA